MVLKIIRIQSDKLKFVHGIDDVGWWAIQDFCKSHKRYHSILTFRFVQQICIIIEQN